MLGGTSVIQKAKRIQGFSFLGLRNDFYSNNDNNDPWGVLLEAPLGGYQRLKNQECQMHHFKVKVFVIFEAIIENLEMLHP